MHPSNYLNRCAGVLVIVACLLAGCDASPAPSPAADASPTPDPTQNIAPAAVSEAPDPCAGIDCDDGLFCNGQETCESGVCVAGDDPCPDRFCDQTLRACVDCFSDMDCDDGLFCNGDETCADGSCQTAASPCSGEESCNESHEACLQPLTLELAGCPSQGVSSGTQVTLTALVSGGLDEHTDYAWRVVEGDATLSSTRSKTTTVQTESDGPITVEVAVMDQDVVDGGWTPLDSAVAACTLAEVEDQPSSPIEGLADAPVSGVVPLDYGPDGATVEISVSPVDAQGELLTEGFTLGNFTFSELTVSPLLAPSVVIAEGNAVPFQLTILKPPHPGRGVSIAMLLDSTWSMVENDPRRLRVDAGRSLVEILRHKDDAAVGDFRTGGEITAGFRKLRLLQDFTSNQGALNAALEKVVASGATPLYDALLDGIDLLLRHRPGRPALVVLTDGMENASKQGTYASVVAFAVEAGIPVFPIGLGVDVDFSELQRLAEETGGTFASAIDADELERLFENIGVAVTAGRIVIRASIAFSPYLPTTGVYTVSGVLATEADGVTRESEFSFQVDLGVAAGQ